MWTLSLTNMEPIIYPNVWSIAIMKSGVIVSVYNKLCVKVFNYKT